MNILHDVNLYYKRHEQRITSQGLEKMKGPQCYDDRLKVDLLHYYGNGWYKWYRVHEFKKYVSSPNIKSNKNDIQSNYNRPSV